MKISGTHRRLGLGTTLDFSDAAKGKGVAALWARNKITALEESEIHGADPEMVKREITKTALDYGLVSKYTSLVAVDVTPSRPQGEDVVSTKVPTLLPAGWVWNKLFGPRRVNRAPAPTSPATSAFGPRKQTPHRPAGCNSPSSPTPHRSPPRPPAGRSRCPRRQRRRRKCCSPAC